MSDKWPRSSARVDGCLARHEPDSLSVSEQCELLANARRRGTLRYVGRYPGESVGIADLADHLAAGDPDANRRDVAVALHHVHLPKLANAGVVEYDPERRQVEYVPHDDLEDLLAFLNSR